MIIVGENYFLSDDIAEKHFVCDLQKCKGACCVEGEGGFGAPLEETELPILEEIYEKVQPYLTKEGKKVIAEKGVYVKDSDGDWGTPVIDGQACAYVMYEEDGTAKCGIEQAYYDKKIDFKKPISCHLYPVRTTKYETFEAINYERWDICDPACTLGEALQVPLYKFLKEAFTRKYGEEWYAELCKEIEEREA